ncbi:MAG: hypothetical protein RID23_15945 [Roseovarius sp.]
MSQFHPFILSLIAALGVGVICGLVSVRSLVQTMEDLMSDTVLTVVAGERGQPGIGTCRG